ncbi:MAG: tetratricopeptide repeat protein [bacterium]|nr:tetratricopeptide repeat protein [bacterium]
MSVRPELVRIRDRLAGKWQIPLLLVSVALLVGSLMQLEPPDAQVPVETLIQRIEAEIEGRMYGLAVTDCRRLLDALVERDRDADEGKLSEETGRVNLLLAQALALRADAPEGRSPAEAQGVIAAYEKAAAAGQTLTWQDHRRIGLAREWQQQFDAAVTSYEQAVAGAGDEGLELRRRIIELMQHPLEVGDEKIHAALDSFLTDARDRPELMQWAVTRKVELLAAEGKTDEALTLLDQLRPLFEPTPYLSPFDYMVAWTLYRAAEFDRAEATLRDLRNRQTVRNEVTARSGWLLGRVVLRDDGPQRPAEALAFFREVVGSRATGLYADAARLGQAEALALLERFDQALEQYQFVIEVLGKYTDSRILNPDVVRTSMTVTAEQLSGEERFAQALAFLEPAAELVDRDDIEAMSTYLQRLGDWRSALARTLREEAAALPAEETSEQQRQALLDRSESLLLSAGETFLRLARINTPNEARAAAGAWRAADRFDEAGDRARAAAVLREFIRERPNHNLVSRALRRLGESLQALGRYDEAVDAYQENLRRFPRTPDAGSALVPLARCFLALGPEYYDQAEKTCRIILEDSPIFTPQAPEFADALFLLGDLLSRQGRFEETIPRLREAMQRYPDDSRRVRAEFLLGDAYRQSGLALREDLANARFMGERDRLRAEHVRRLEEAAKLFQRLIVRYEDRDATELDESEALFLRYARLYEADCLYELRRYAEALKRYERAAWIYRDTPLALAAYVQIINCHRYLGYPGEARAALRRAQYLVQAIPESQFAEAESNGRRADWEQYLTWVEQSELF